MKCKASALELALANDLALANTVTDPKLDFHWYRHANDKRISTEEQYLRKELEKTSLVQAQGESIIG